MVYPANYPEVVAVGAATSGGQLAGFSSYGPNLDVIAPGVNLFTTTWLPSNGTSAYAANISGTSLATPIVSGLLTRLKSLQPTAAPLELIAALTENTNRLSLPAGIARSNTLGFGLIDGGRASQRLVTPDTPVQRYIFTPISFGRDLNPSQPSEVPSGTAAYQCENAGPGSTPVYELAKGGLTLFSASTAEVQEALAMGYSANFLSYTCLSEPHDQPGSVVRNINLYKEFFNLDSK
jgi:subtilisin family serine protease